MHEHPTPAAGTPAAEQYLTEPEAAARLTLSPAYLKVLRLRGAGPRHLRIGRRVVYRVGDVDRWAAEHAAEAA